MANKTTKDHGEIRRWAEERGGKPSHVKDTGSTEDIGILRIDFPGYSGQGSLETVTWEAWFDKFDERNLALLYQDETAEGQSSNFNQIVTSETAREAETGAGRGTRARRGGSRAKRAPIKKAAAKKAPIKKAAAKKGIKRSASARKKATKRPAKRHAARRTSRSRSAGAKRTAAKKPSASRSSRKRSAGKKSSTKKRR